MAGYTTQAHFLIVSFTTEWRAFPMTTWGATAKGPTTVRAEELGYVSAFTASHHVQPDGGARRVGARDRRHAGLPVFDQ